MHLPSRLHLRLHQLRVRLMAAAQRMCRDGCGRPAAPDSILDDLCDECLSASEPGADFPPYVTPADGISPFDRATTAVRSRRPGR